ncbi:MAG: hypothetical protein J6S91_08530 [Treponema sp.]|nr:hypothetical protein [Treponema sp.]
MAEENRDLYGKKIYFVSPPYSIRNHVIPLLRDMEYEVYTIDNYRDLKNILRKNPYSVCFINLDSHLTTYGWFVFVDEFKEDEKLKDVSVGFISERITATEKEYFLKNLPLAGGIINPAGVMNKIAEKIADILEMNNAKGRRKYVRANCLNDKSAVLFYTQNNLLHQLKLVDISIVGAAVKLESNDDLPQINSVIRSATLKLGTRQFIVDFVVFAIHQRGERQLMITLFVPETVSGFKTAIQEYIYDILQEQVMAEISNDKPDDKQYNQLGKSIAEAVHAQESAKKKK